MNRSTVLLVACLALHLAWIVPAAAVTIDTVLVGNPGNPNDPLHRNRYGGVPYAYRIGTYEVTIEQYVAFLNAVAKTDTYGLYNAQMGVFFQTTGIARINEPGSYQYNVIGSPQRPAIFVSWADGARFANWLHNGQPTGAQDGTTTEDGAYALNGATTNQALNLVVRKPGAKWFLPTENEWYKAAYHQPASQGGQNDNYWRYPTRTDAYPASDQPPGIPSIRTNVANIYRDDFLNNGYNDGFAVTGSTNQEDIHTDHLTDVGAYLFAPSFYGTFDQAGNVAEWNEALNGTMTARGARGGSFNNDQFGVDSGGSVSLFPTVENVSYGFRMAAIPSVPEPSTLALAALGAMGLLIAARRKLTAPTL